MFGGLVIGVIIEGHDGEWYVCARVSSFLDVVMLLCTRRNGQSCIIAYDIRLRFFLYIIHIRQIRINFEFLS